MATVFDVKKFAAQGNEAFQKAKVVAAENSFENPPAGPYTVRLEKMELGMSKAGNYQMLSKFRILKGADKWIGKFKFDYMRLDVAEETELGLQPLCWRLNHYGVELPEDLRKLPELLEEIVKDKPVSKIQLINTDAKDRNGQPVTYQNLRMTELIDDYEDDETASPLSESKQAGLHNEKVDTTNGNSAVKVEKTSDDEEDGIEVGDKVRWVNPTTNKPQTGIIKSIDTESMTVNVKFVGILKEGMDPEELKLVEKGAKDS